MQLVRCAHRPCLNSGKGLPLFELGPECVAIAVTALACKSDGYRIVKKCEHCGGLNGINYSLRQAA